MTTTPSTTVQLPGRPPRRRGPLIAGIVGGVVLLAAAGTVAAIAVGVSTARDLRTDSVTETFGGVRELVVDLDEGTVRLTAGPALEVRTIRSWTPGHEPAAARVQDGGTLRVTGDCPSPNGACEVDQEITVPPGTAVTLSTEDGTVDATDLDVARFSARTTNGAVDAGFVGAPGAVAVETVNGAVTVVLPPGGYRVGASAVVGSVQVSVPQDPAGVPVDVETVNGAVAVRPR
jgi:hypothetical protein